MAPQIEAGNVYLPGAPNAKHSDYDPSKTPLWIRALVDECASFPNAAHDDQVDALSQALNRMAGTNTGILPSSGRSRHAADRARLRWGGGRVPSQAAPPRPSSDRTRDRRVARAPSR